MKTKKHITLSLAVLLLLLALLSACNADASAGLFRQIADSQAPIGIVYRQLLGLETTEPKTLYYRTDEGIYKTDLTTRTKMQASVKGAIIQAAYHIAGSDSVLYIINDSNDVKKTDNSSSNLPNNLSNSLLLNNSEFKVKNLYANGLAMLQGEDNTSQLRYELANTTAYPNFTTVETFPYMAGYGLDSVLQMTGFEYKPISATYPILVSFVNKDKLYIHYYYQGGASTAVEITGLPSTRLAAFSVVDSTLYAISSNDANLYKGTISSSSFSLTSIYDGSKDYGPNAFFYGVTDETTTHLISKTNTKAEDLFVYSVDASNNVTTASIDEGYAKYLANADIVSALYVDTNLEGDKDSLLVATNDNGLFKIEINHAFANINSIANGSSTKSEEYNFDLF